MNGRGNGYQKMSNIVEYKLQSDIVKMCEVFSSKVIHTNADEYYRRKQSDLEKIWNDIFYGKLAEWGVYFIYLERERTNIDPPDMRIYSAKDKSFDPDLRYGLFNIHVKSQTYESAEKFGDSWMFQSKDPLLVQPNEYDILIGCRVLLSDRDKTAMVKIKLEKPFMNLVIGEPRLSKFVGSKKTIYLKDNL